MPPGRKPDPLKDVKKQVLAARQMIEEVARLDGNEAETRRRIERIFERLCGYEMQHLSREFAVSAQGATTEYCDFAILPFEDDRKKPVVMVEIKRVGIELDQKHLRQVASYAINEGCEWILLTNSRDWQLHHVSFGQPPVTKRVESWNLINDDPGHLADRFALISLKSLRKGALDSLWQKANVLSASSLLSAIFTQDCRTMIKRELKRSTGVAITDEELILAIRRLLNETAGAAVEAINVKIAASAKRGRKKAVQSTPKSESPSFRHLPITQSGLSPDPEEHNNIDLPPGK